MARFETANNIINRAAVEVGLNKSADPVASTNDAFIQMTELLTGGGQEMVEMFAWQGLVMPFQVITSSADSGTYPLPDDFSYMIDQTGWEYTNRVSMGGPLSAQDWTYLRGRDLVSQSIYASFRIMDNEFSIYPNDPVPDALDINFEYISRNWVQEVANGDKKDHITAGSDIVLYEPILIIKFLKVKFLESRGFDATAAKTEFEYLFLSRTGKDTGAPILNAANSSRGFPYLTPYRNTGDTGYGVA